MLPSNLMVSLLRFCEVPRVGYTDHISFEAHELGNNEAANSSGNSRKSMHVSLRESLKKLQTDYVSDQRQLDLWLVDAHLRSTFSTYTLDGHLPPPISEAAYVQWDYTTSIEELMDSLDVFVKQGKVLYLGVSNVPAWIVSACNTYAKWADPALPSALLITLGLTTRRNSLSSRPNGISWSTLT